MNGLSGGSSQGNNLIQAFSDAALENSLNDSSKKDSKAHKLSRTRRTMVKQLAKREKLLKRLAKKDEYEPDEMEEDDDEYSDDFRLDKASYENPNEPGDQNLGGNDFPRMSRRSKTRDQSQRDEKILRSDLTKTSGGATRTAVTMCKKGQAHTLL